MAKNPVRSFAKHFTNLTDGQRREFERALAELDNSQEITNLVASLDFLRRKPNQGLAVPQVTVTPIVRGGILKWNPLDDQRISVYEIQISTRSNFSSITTSFTFGTQAIIEGLSTTTFARVRGIRSDGTQGPFSNIITIAPFIFSIKARVAETFYFNLEDSVAYTLLGGDNSSFDYQPINAEGFSMFWGSVYAYGNPEIDVKGQDEFTMKLIGKVKETAVETEYWRNTAAGYHGTYQIGPVTIPHPEEQQTLSVRLEVQDTSPTSPRFYPSAIPWAHFNSLELGTKTTDELPFDFYPGSNL